MRCVLNNNNVPGEGGVVKIYAAGFLAYTRDYETTVGFGRGENSAYSKIPPMKSKEQKNV